MRDVEADEIEKVTVTGHKVAGIYRADQGDLHTYALAQYDALPTSWMRGASSFDHEPASRALVETRHRIRMPFAIHDPNRCQIEAFSLTWYSWPSAYATSVNDIRVLIWAPTSKVLVTRVAAAGVVASDKRVSDSRGRALLATE